MNTNTLTLVAVLAGLPGMRSLPYPEATAPIKMHLMEDHEVGGEQGLN